MGDCATPKIRFETATALLHIYIPEAPHPDLAVGLEAFYHHLPLSLVLQEVAEDLFLIRVDLSYPLWPRPSLDSPQSRWKSYVLLASRLRQIAPASR
jgi:hypothetical protein